jgi:hypothetical protein
MDVKNILRFACLNSAHDGKYTQQRLARRLRIAREALQTLSIKTPLFQIALANTAAILLRSRRGDLQVDSPPLMCPGIQDVITPAPGDHGHQRIAE